MDFFFKTSCNKLCIVTNLDVGNRLSLTITKWTHTQMVLFFYISYK